MATQPRRAAIYARLSQTTDESVSIARQLEAGRKYAEARGYTVTLEAKDDGVSATKLAPEKRPGWQRVLAAAPDLDAVIVWKIDRLARNVLDFLNADRALTGHGCGVVSVEDPIDMTTPTGRAFATMLAVFAELEAAGTRARVTAARAHVLATDPARVLSGKPLWPYRSVSRDGLPGKRLEPIPHRADAVRAAADALIGGQTALNRLARDWQATPGLEAEGRWWDAKMIGRILRNPILYGAMIVQASKLDANGRKIKLDPPVLARNDDGTVQIDEGRVILDRDTWAQLQAAIERPPAAVRGHTGPWLLAGLLWCAGAGDDVEHGRVSSATRARHGVPRYVCQNPGCMRSIDTAAADAAVGDEFLARLGDWPVMTTETTGAVADPGRVAELREAIAAVTAELVSEPDPERLPTHGRRRIALQDELDAALRNTGASVLRETGETIRDAWNSGGVLDRAALMEPWIREVRLLPGRRGAGGPATERLVIDWDAEVPGQ